MTSFSRIDTSTTPAKVTVERAYNAAVDIVDRHGQGALAEKTCLIDDAGSYSYAELGAAANRAGNALLGLDVRPEQRVVMCMTDGIDLAAVFFGAIKAGLVAVPLNTMLTSDDYEHMLRDSRAPVLVVSAPLLERFEPLLDRARGSKRLRLCVSAGEALPKHIGETWEARFGAPILDGIGSTEMLHIFLSNTPDDNRYGTTGKPVPGYEVRLLDEAGQAVGAGEVGELWVGGPSASPYYWNNREKSLDTFHGPWTRTGDKYVRDHDGYYIYAGRSDDMLKVGGIWVSPFEVESALLADDEVLEVAVVGREDADRLVKPMAYVVLKDAASGSEAKAEALKAFVKDRIAPYKYPRWIDFVEALPKTATGKIQRFKLRD